MKKIDIEETKKIFKKYGYNIFRDCIKSSKEKITAEKNGYLYYISLEFLKVNEGSGRLWHKTNPYSIYNINKWLKENNINTYTIDGEYKSLTDKMNWICVECGNVYKDTFEHIKSKKHGKCQNCGNKMCHDKRIKTIDNIEEIFREAGLTILERYNKTHDRIKCMTNDGYLVNSNYYNAINKTKPMIFHPLNPYTIYNIKHYIKLNKIKSKLLSEVYVSEEDYMEFECECGNIYKTRLDSFIYNKKHRCNICSKRISKGEYKISNWLKDNKINNMEQYRFDDCRNKYTLPFDFYLPDYNTCIEMDGIQHDEIVEFFGGIDGYNYRKKNDKIKEEFCKKNNIKLIRIKYKDIMSDEYINILNKYIINT